MKSAGPLSATMAVATPAVATSPMLSPPQRWSAASIARYMPDARKTSTTWVEFTIVWAW